MGNLLERTDALAAVETALGEASGERGAVVLVSGTPGVGRSALLAAAADLARRQGFRVLTAHGAELEREHGFGVARQLFEQLVQAEPALLEGVAALAAPTVTATVAGPPPGDPAAPLHGLYWLTVAVADREPLLLVVDDAQWADAASLRFLAYLARRLEGLRVAVLVAVRDGEPGAPELAALAADPRVTSVPLQPLSAHATAELAGRLLGADADPDFCAACHEASGGNPFLAQELLRQLAADGVHAETSAARRVAGLVPATIARSVVPRLARLGPDAVALATAAAVLGDDATLRTSAALGSLDLERAAVAADELAAAGVLLAGPTLTFPQSVIRQAVYQELGAASGRARHKRAARLLGDEGAPPSRVSAQLVPAEREGDPWVVEVLRAAAADEVGRGAPDAAALLLDRALAEPPAREARGAVLRELGMAELLSAGPNGLGHLTEAVAAASDAVERTVTAAMLAFGHSLLGDVERVPDVLVPVIEELPEPLAPMRHMLLAALIAPLATDERAKTAWAWLGRTDPDQLGDSPDDRALLAMHAVREVTRAGGDSQTGSALARRALAGDPLGLHPGYLQHETNAVSALVTADALDEAIDHYDAMVGRAQRRGAIMEFAVASCFRGWALSRVGRLREAEADALAALAVTAGNPALVGLDTALRHVVVDVLLDLGDVDRARSTLREASAEAAASTMINAGWLSYSEGRLALEERRYDDALAAFAAAGSRWEPAEWLNPSVLHWRSGAARALASLGREEEAAALAQEELAMARAFGAPRAIGVASRTVGLLAGGDQAVELLREATDVLADSPAELEHARALVAYGAALRRANRRADAREPLRVALDVAVRCGAHPLAEEARTELVACGGRPRRLLLTGVDALTASERRIAELAADGLSNTEIAQAQFVTRKTVEKHLGAVYRKLDISTRSELATAFAAESSVA